MDKSHQSTEKYNITTDPAVVFGGKPSCVLSPETTEGPFCKSACKHLALAHRFFGWDCTRLISTYAVVDGEGIRSQLIDDQVGVPVYLDIQVIDVNTCEPLQDTFVEMWSKLPS